MFSMTRLLQEAFGRISQLAEDQQDRIAHMLLTLVSEKADLPRLTREQIEQVRSSLLEAEAGKFVDEDAVNEVYDKYGTQNRKI